MSDSSVPPTATPTEPGADASGQAAQGPLLQTLAQYLKDLSFENPSPLESLTLNNPNPTVNVNVSVATRPAQDSVHELAITLRVHTLSGEKSLFLIEMTYCGLFALVNIPQDQIEPIHDVVEPEQWRCRIENKTRFAAMITNQLQAPIDVIRGLGVKRNKVGSSLGKIDNQSIHRRNHQMHVNRDGDMGTHRRTDHRTHRKVGHVVIVHDIKMQQVGARRLHCPDLFAQPRKVSREDARG
jgi:preprotein translocase subunit SecB